METYTSERYAWSVTSKYVGRFPIWKYERTEHILLNSANITYRDNNCDSLNYSILAT